MPVPIAFVLLHLDPGGFERVVVNLLGRLDRRRFRPVVILLHGYGRLCDLLPDDVEVVRLEVKSRSAPPTLARQFRQRGIRAVFAGPTAANIAAMAAVTLMRRPPGVVVNEHTPPGLSLRQKTFPALYRWLMRRLYPRAAAIGVPIRTVGEELEQVLGRALPVVELKNPIFDDRLAELAGAEPSVEMPPSPVFVAAGRMVAEKGFDVLVDALARLPVGDRPPHLLILGDGEEREALARRAERLGLGERVRLPGVVANPFPFFQRATALVVSSLREATPNVLIEAMACGTPVISTECWSGPRAVLDDGRAGLLVPPGDPDALAAAMGRILAAPAEAAERAARGRRRAQAYHVDRTLPAIEEVLARAAGC